ncbi:MAG: hypothetical protein EBZ47_04520 [Chlamydiae bacterium]|nr:hypothetical protein [Chlamydiota bacterium]
MTGNHSLFRGISSIFATTIGLCLLNTQPLFSGTFSSQEAFLFKRITEYWKEGEVDITQGQIKNYLEKFPESSAKDYLYAILGDLYTQQHDYESALGSYKKIESDDVASKVGFNKAVCLYETQKNDELIEFVTRTLAYPVQIKESETLQLFLAESFLRKAVSSAIENEKEGLLNEALSHYKSLAEGKYSEFAIAPAAEISELLGKKEEACQYYEILLQKNPQDKEILLFKIATLQEEIKPKEAIKCYGMVYKLKGNKAPEASIRQLKVLFREQKFKELLIYQEEAMRFVSEEDLPQAHYFIGKSLYHLEDFFQAQEHLLHTLASDKLTSSDKKILLTSLANCANRTKDSRLLEKVIFSWEELDPNDLDLAEAYLMLHQLLSTTDKKASCQTLKRFVEKFSSHKEKESALYNLACLQYRLETWDECAQTLDSLLQEFPESKFFNTASRMKLNCRIEDVRSSKPDTLKIKKEALATTLKELLHAKKSLTNQEKIDYHLLFCQLLFQLEKTEDGIHELLEFIENNPSSNSLGQAYSMLAHLYLNQESNHSLFIRYAQKALTHPISSDEKRVLESKLYNSFLLIAESAPYEQKEEFISQAADHLFRAYREGASLNKENIFWLSGFYFDKAKEFLNENKNEYLEKSTILFEDILHIANYPPSAELTDENSANELETLKLADLLGWQKRFNEKIDLLEVLVFQQKNHPLLHWKYQRRTLLELSRAYAEAGSYQDALETYEYLITSSEYISSYISNLAVLEKAKLRYTLIPQQSFKENNPEYLSILDDLKELAIKKDLASEPIHLEASLAYIECKTAHLFGEKQREKQLFLLEQMKENFFKEESPEVIKYLAPKDQYPGKAAQWKNYMDLVDAMILLNKAESAKSLRKNVESQSLAKKAQDILQELSRQKQLSSDLQTKVQLSKEALERIL